jgi:hypothetical protein
MSHYCSVCAKTVEAGLHTIRLECKCWVHTKCLDNDNPDFEKCARCKGQIGELRDPGSYNGHDYVQNPVAPYRIQKLWKSEPFCWLREHKPLDWIVNDRGYGLHRLIASGVTIDDLFTNGYDWDQLRRFPDVQKRCHQSLMALGCNAEHFRDFGTPGTIDGKSLVDYYGFHFPPNGGKATVAGGKNQLKWTIADLHPFGITMQNLLDAGMEYVEQYAHLEIKDEDEPKIGVTDALFDRLKVFSAPALKTTETLPTPQIGPTGQSGKYNPEVIYIHLSPTGNLPPRRRAHALKKN